MSVDAYIPQDQRERKKRRIYFVIVIVVIIVYAIAVATAWFFLRAPFWRISGVEVVGSKQVKNGEVVALIYSRLFIGARWKTFLGVNHLLAWPDELAGGDLIFEPRIKSLKIAKDYRSRRVRVVINEREPYGIWCLRARSVAERVENYAEEGFPRQSASDSCWWFDDEGVIIKKGVFARGSMIAAVVDEAQEGLGLNFKILPERLIRNMFSIFDVLKKSRVRIAEIGIRDLTLEETEVRTFDGPNLLFSLNFSARNALVVIEDMKKRPRFGELEYLDFRVEDRVYYK